MSWVKFLSVSVSVRWWLTQSLSYANHIWITPHLSAKYAHYCTVPQCFAVSQADRYKWLNTAVCFIIGVHTHRSCVLICYYPIQLHASCPAYRFITVTIVYKDIWGFKLLENDKVQSVRPAEQNCKLEEIKTRLNPGNASYHLVQNFFSCCLLYKLSISVWIFSWQLRIASYDM